MYISKTVILCSYATNCSKALTMIHFSKTLNNSPRSRTTSVTQHIRSILQICPPFSRITCHKNGVPRTESSSK